MLRQFLAVYFVILLFVVMKIFKNLIILLVPFLKMIGVLYFWSVNGGDYCQSQWPRGLRRRSAAARLLKLWVRISRGAWMFVCCEF